MQLQIYGGNAPEAVDFGEFGAVVHNETTDSIYYADNDDFVIGTQEGTLTGGSTATLYGVQYFLVPRTTWRVTLTVVYLEEDTTGRGDLVFVQSSSEMRSLAASEDRVYYLGEAGREGFFQVDANDSSSADNDGTVLVNGFGSRLKRISETRPLRPEWFGAKGDWEDDPADATIGDGTDDSDAFRNLAEWAMENDRDGILLSAEYLVDDPTPICLLPADSNSGSAFSIVGTTEHPWASRGKGAAIIRREPGTIFHLNLDEDGNEDMPSPGQWTRFGMRNFSVIAKSATAGVTPANITAFKAWRTRMYCTALYGSRLDWFIDQPEHDAGGVNTNYADMSRYQDIALSYSTQGGLRLQKADSSLVDGFFFERPYATVETGLEIVDSSGVTVRRPLHWTPGTDPDGTSYSAPSGSYFIHAIRSQAVFIEGGHLERMVPYEAAINLFGCMATTINGVNTRYARNTFVRNHNSDLTTVERCYLWDNPTVGSYDIDIVGDPLNNRDFKWRDIWAEDNPGHVKRPVTVNGSTFRNTDARDGELAIWDSEAYTGDVNVSLDDVNRIHRLGAITANRTVTIPDGVKDGDYLILINRNTASGFTWSRSGAEIRKPDGTNITVIPYQSSMFLWWDPDVLVWRVIFDAIGDSWNHTPKRKVTGYSANRSVDPTVESVVKMSASGGAVTATLPAAASWADSTITVIKTDATANAVNVAAASGSVLGTASFTTQYTGGTWASDGTNWVPCPA